MTGGQTGSVESLVVQGDGKTLLGGDFSSYNGVSRSGLVRVNTDGGLDTAFNSGGTGTGSFGIVRALVLQADAKVVLGGSFTIYNGVSRNNIARVNTDGSLDTTFNPGTGADSSVDSLALQSDGRILLGGFFTSYNGVTRNKLARINTNGSLDTTLNSGGAPAGFSPPPAHCQCKVMAGLCLGGNSPHTPA